MSRARLSPEWSWGLLAAIALLWPDRISGPWDGMPLDTTAEAVLVGAVFPALWWFHPRFLATRFPRVCILALLGWKVLTAVALVQDGWCVKFVPSAPFVKGGTGALHSWDIRGDWRSDNPSCSAVMTRAYDGLSDFPAWFFNLPPATDMLPALPAATDRPPGATIAMTVEGFLRAPRAGVLQIITGPDVAARMYVDEGSASAGSVAGDGVPLTSGIHRIRVDAKLTGDRWRFVPLWNGADLWSQSIATLKKPSRRDLAVRPWGRWMVAALVAALVVAWLASAVARIGDSSVLTWTIGASSCIGLLAAMGHENLARWLVAGLVGAVFLRVPTRLKNMFGAFTLIGIPWLTLIVVVSAPLSGRFTLYTAGDDYWTFQRFAYRIFLQGYWLEGGSATFWFQPLYRWIAGGLHMIFGDSSMGEWYWDGACVLATALFSFHVAKVFAGFRWGLVAAVTTLGVFTLGTTWVFVGRGLSEISSAGLLSLAALLALRSRHGNWRWALAAGTVATLGFYARLNTLPMAFAIVLFALPVRQPVWTASRPGAWLSRASWQTVAGVTMTLCLGLLLFAWRTWHYTGVFSVFYGTQREHLAVWQTGMSPTSLLARVMGSIMMVLTMNDPARFDPHAVPVLAGAAVSVLAIAGVPGLRELPLAAVLLCLASVSGALVARGSAYPGRFSIHVIAVACTVAVCTVALMSRAVEHAFRKSPADSGARTPRRPARPSAC
jgi:hypothetical protein